MFSIEHWAMLRTERRAPSKRFTIFSPVKGENTHRPDLISKRENFGAGCEIRGLTPWSGPQDSCAIAKYNHWTKQKPWCKYKEYSFLPLSASCLVFQSLTNTWIVTVFINRRGSVSYKKHENKMLLSPPLLLTTSPRVFVGSLWT